MDSNGLTLSGSEALLERVIAYLKTADAAPRVWLVGGYVRDRLLGRPTHDLDLVVPEGAIALARTVADAFDGHFFVLDEERQVARAIVGGDPGPAVDVDIATLRAPELREDLRLRDFTVNAIAMEVSAGDAGFRVFDPFDGRADIKRGVLRAVTEGAFRDDPLRLLRAIRMAAELGLHVEPRTFSLMRRDAELLTSASAERIADELHRILAAPGAWQHLRLLAQADLLRHALPEAAALIGVEQSPPHYQDVFDHTRSVLAHLAGIFALLWPRSPYRRPGPVTGDATVICPAPMWNDAAALLEPFREDLSAYLDLPLASGRSRRDGLIWAALAHDWGKPAMRTDEETTGRIRFFDHDNWGALLAQNRVQALKMSTGESDYIARVVRMHMRPGLLSQDYPPSKRAIYRFFKDAQDAGVDTVLLSLADHMAARAPRPDLDSWHRRLGTTRLLLESYFRRRAESVAPEPLFDGHRIMAEFGLKPGPQIGQLIEGLREAQAADEVTTEDEALAWLTEHVRQEQ